MTPSFPGQFPESGAQASPTAPLAKARIECVDLLRGLVIMLMALDHARDFYGLTPFDPTDLAQTTPALFITRWITHFCAPVFVFLAGTSAALSGARGKSRGQVARGLILRGIWLIFLELTLIRWGWFIGFAADFSYQFVGVQVIWALGWSMIILAGLIYLPRWLMFALTCAIVLGHNAFDSVSPEGLGRFSALWKVLHVFAPIQWGGSGGGHILLIKYPLVPWIAVMALGYLFASILRAPSPAPELGRSPGSPLRSGSLSPRAARTCVLLGLGLTLAFIILRLTNLYGDPHPWTRQGRPSFTFFSFLNVEKYPPSLCYLLVTLGPALAAIPLLERLPGVLRSIISTFGKVPMFFYIAHLYLLQLSAVGVAYLRYGPAIFGWNEQDVPDDFSLGLPIVYTAWAAALFILYFPCRWFAAKKQRGPRWWHGYL